jgi:hypothetical protein
MFCSLRILKIGEKQAFFVSAFGAHSTFGFAALPPINVAGVSLQQSRKSGWDEQSQG